MLPGPGIRFGTSAWAGIRINRGAKRKSAVLLCFSEIAKRGNVLLRLDNHFYSIELGLKKKAGGKVYL